MSSALVIAMPGNERFASEIAAALGTETGQIETRHFPDGESYVRFRSDVRDRELVMVATLDRPDCKYLPLHFAAAAARELGASRVGLVAPYLAYMRQDRRFHEGEAVTSRTFARLLSSAFDWLVTVDPHLHRTGSLSEIYSIPAKAVPCHAADFRLDQGECRAPGDRRSRCGKRAMGLRRGGTDRGTLSRAQQGAPRRP
jgi:ribose-phosphate pyrophosphokinase